MRANVSADSVAARVQAVKIRRQLKADGWQNLVSGLGTAADKQRSTRALMSGIMTDEELEDIFVDDGLGTNIVKAIPDDMFREGWEYDFPDDDEIESENLTDEYNAVLENIGAISKITEAFYWARLYGGAAILIGALDGKDLSQPLNPSRIKNIEYLKIIDRSDIEFSKIKFQLDPTLPRYGLPELYPIKFINSIGTEESKNVHYTRVIEIHGEPIPDGATRYGREQRYWGVSVLQNVDDKLRIVGTSIGSVSHLLHEFSIGKYKLGDLAYILSQPDGEKLIRKRVEIMDLTRSVYHSQYFDKEDDFIRDNVSFTGVPEVLHVIFMLVSSSTQIPITRLFGISPAGMNSTGESDMRNYYDKVRSKQSKEAAPILLRLVRIISEWKKLPEPYVIWKPLQQLSPKEQAEVDKLEADKEQVKASTYQAYINAGIMEPYEARFLQFGDTLDKIPVPEDLIPEVKTLPDVEEPDEGQEGTDDEPSTEDRIAELEEKEELSEKEKEELEELKKKLEED